MPISPRQFLFLLCSTRRLANSEQLAYVAANSLPAGTEQQWLHLQDWPLPAFTDLRHHASFPPPAGNARVLLEATLRATDVVLVAPLYLYNLPAQAKHYLDYWNAWLRLPALKFRERMQDKTMWAILVSSGSKIETKPLEETLMLTARYMQMDWGGMLYGSGSRPNDIQNDALALQQAKSFFAAPQPSFEFLALPLASKKLKASQD